MMNTLCRRWFAMTLLAGAGMAMTAVSFDAEARRFGGGMSSGRQSPNVMQQRQAVTPPATAPRAAGAAPAAGARWLGPVAGIAAAFGLAALFAQFGLSGALADLFVLALLALVAGLGIVFIMRTLRGLSAVSHSAPSGMQRRRYAEDRTENRAPVSGLLGSAPVQVQPTAPQAGDWFIPADFDQAGFLDEAKRQFIAVQKAWDSMDFDGLQARLTDEMYAQYAGQMAAHGGQNRTEVVLLNADLMGIEKLADGHLASVRFSGMIREQDHAQANSFEEAWNLYQPDGKGWLLAGIQQLPAH